MKKTVLIIAAVVIFATVGYFSLAASPEQAPVQKYIKTVVQRGNLQEKISATGTLEPVNTVEVGTQVSGRVDQIFADFNDKVTAGTVVAKIDDTLLKAQVEDAKVNLMRLEAQKKQSELEFERIAKLFDKKAVSESEYYSAKYSLDQIKAQYQSMVNSLDRANLNLGYATIISPVDGVVIHRNVSEGQTVAASMSAPTLFTIAEDMERMEIEALVDEADIGKIAAGQKVEFSVQAYEDETFYGTVEQIRLQPATSENVVNYTVIVSTTNSEGKLLPGMTATVDFIVSNAEDVLLVESAALRFRPNVEDLAALQENMRARFANRSDSSRARRAGQAGQMGGANRPQFGGGAPTGANFGSGRAAMMAGRRSNFNALYAIDSTGVLRMLPTRVGISDGKFTQITSRMIQEGDTLIRAYNPSYSTGATESNSVFQSLLSNGGSGRRGPGPGF